MSSSSAVLRLNSSSPTNPSGFTASMKMPLGAGGTVIPERPVLEPVNTAPSNSEAIWSP